MIYADPVESLELSTNDSKVTGGVVDEFEFTLNTPEMVTCTSKGGFPTPRLIISRFAVKAAGICSLTIYI